MRISGVTAWLLTAMLVVFSGCGKHPAPPTARNDLVLRFFNSLQTGNAKAASEQGKKLLALEPNNDFISKIIEVQESNQGVQAAQRAINSRNINQALQIIDQSIRQYPDNRTLPQLRAQIRQLRNARPLLAAMKRADSAEAMSSALTAATTGLSANTTPKLAAYFEAYEKEIEARRAEEAKRMEEAAAAARREAETPVGAEIPETK
ncbi:MAG: hypothetical protein MJ016_01975 [Victivallaceae bacterium]|nr:hypothetical protein [Victivallaceae bacterium]